MDLDRVKETFIKHALIHEETEETGNYRRGNKSSKILFTLFEKIKRDPVNGPIIVDNLLNETNPSVLIWTSVISIQMNHRKKHSIAILRRLSKDHSIGQQRFNAKMTLREFG
ncbi:hypothetical protein [Alkalicoccobacillus gibsonii]|uniref:hypothetical protein n=1 Tax=Alkalicoccobacillus gibsonii TaxID=79881 RepID=UPI001932C0C7|nr:hypothetical protein [Alkalicoccobacillus gibsonii]MBM0065909.1 hypothetical protein [Alkalicoccobacillus gibsonii]